jgi:citrate synthase
LLALFEPPKLISRFIAKVKKLTGLQPNNDVALAAMVAHHRLPQMQPSASSQRRVVSVCSRTAWSTGVTQVNRTRGRSVGPICESMLRQLPDPVN